MLIAKISEQEIENNTNGESIRLPNIKKDLEEIVILLTTIFVYDEHLRQADLSV